MDRENRGNKMLTAILVIIVLAVVAILIFVIPGGTGRLNVENPNDDNENVGGENIITAKHQFVDGIHIIAGELALPTPCHLLETDVVIDDTTDPETVTINFNITQEGEVCAQVITSARFKETFEAGEDARIRARRNGELIGLNLIEAGPNEDLEDFEVFFKG